MDWNKVFNFLHAGFTSFGIICAVLASLYWYTNRNYEYTRTLNPAELRAEIRCNKEKDARP
jgi:hypothetical protein